MINDFKLGIKIVRYGLNKEASVVVTILFLLLGAFMEFVAPHLPLTGLYMGMGGMLLIQMICSVSLSTMVQTSSRKKRLQTSVPAIVGGVYMLLIHTLFLAIKCISCALVTREVFQFNIWEVGNAIMMNALLMAIIIVYYAAALKAFWSSTILFFIVYVGLYSGYIPHNFLVETQAAIFPLGVAIAVSYGIVVIAAVLVYGLYKALYKKDYSKFAFETALKRAK